MEFALTTRIYVVEVKTTRLNVKKWVYDRNVVKTTKKHIQTEFNSSNCKPSFDLYKWSASINYNFTSVNNVRV